jgi:GntR family transcriptional regulator
VLIRLDPKDPTPLFEQVVFQVKAAVAHGDLVPGDRLPSVRELARDLAINPNTVARSYEALESGGVIVRRQGRGCFVHGEQTALLKKERERRLDRLLSRAVTEAFHLGFAESDVRAALERNLRDVRFDSRPGRARPASKEKRT